jgi:hypothetical protein
MADTTADAATKKQIELHLIQLNSSIAQTVIACAGNTAAHGNAPGSALLKSYAAVMYDVNAALDRILGVNSYLTLQEGRDAITSAKSDLNTGVWATDARFDEMRQAIEAEIEKVDAELNSAAPP